MPDDFPQLGSGRGHVGRADPGVPTLSGAHAGVAGLEHTPQQPPVSPSVRPDMRFFARYGVASLLDERGEMRPFGSLEEEVIRFAISHYRGRMSEVARRLGIGRSTLYRKIKDYGIAGGEPVAP